MVYTNGMMVENMKEIGKEEICMEKENMFGPMVDAILVSIKMRHSTALEHTHGQTDGNMKGTGRKILSMVEDDGRQMQGEVG